MKNNGFANFLGCCVIALAILISGGIIAFNLPGTTLIPNDLNISAIDKEAQFGDYLSKYEVAAYLRISDDDVTQLLESGELDAAICKIDENYIISKHALQEWVDSKIAK